MNDTITGVVMIAIGIVAIIGAVLNWRIVSQSGKLLNRIFDDRIARAVYATVGFVLMILGAGRFVG